jgi:hypothetical protein
MPWIMRRCVARFVILFASGSGWLVSPVNVVLCSLQMLKCREADVRNPGAVLIVSIGVAIVGSPHSALAKSDKSTSSIFKHTATGKHYNTTAPHDTPGGMAKPHDDTNPPGGKAKPHDDTNPPGGKAKPHDDTNPPGGMAKPKNPTPPGGTGNGPKLTPGGTGVKNISR